MSLGLIVSEVVKVNSLTAKPEQIRAIVEEAARTHLERAGFVLMKRPPGRPHHVG